MPSSRLATLVPDRTRRYLSHDVLEIVFSDALPFHDDLSDEEKYLSLSSSEESDYQHSSVTQPNILNTIKK